MALTFDEFGMWLHLGGSYWQRASVDAVIIVAAVLGLCGYLRSIERFESRHRWAALALLARSRASAGPCMRRAFGLGDLVGPRLQELEASSSP